MFPGRRAVDNRWFSGIGYLLKGAKTDKKIYVVMAYIQGTSDLDYLRIIPGLSKFLPEIKVTFNYPQEVNDILDKNPKEITSILEEEYNDWIKLII